MPESKHEQILQALVTAALTINGNLPVSKALRHPEFTLECLDESQTTIYCFSPSDEENDEQTFTSTVAHMHVDLAVATRYTPSTENPFTAEVPDRWLLQNRLVQDAEGKFRSAAQINTWRDAGLLRHIQIPIVDRSAERTYHKGWAIAFLRMVIEYDFTDGSS